MEFGYIIKDNQERLKILKVKKRNYAFYKEILDLNKIVSFIWPRRVWKTYLMFQFLLEMIEDNTYALEQIVFIDFSVYKGEVIEPEDIVKSYYALWNTKRPVFVLDEVQDIENYQKLVLTFYTQGYQVFISGSNSKLLSSELVTEFRGRVYEYFVNPLDFEEILEFNHIKKEKKYSSSTQWKIKAIFNNVLVYGSFPELVIAQSPIVKNDVLKTYFDILFYKDLIERYKIENEKAMRFLIKKILLWNTKRLNLIKVFNDLQSQGIKIWKNTIYSYYEYLKNIFFVDDVKNFFQKNENIYLYNVWFWALFWYSENKWQGFENMIYLHLKKKYERVFHKEDKNEIDFYIPSIETNIQACYNLNRENFDRETEALKKQPWKNILVYFEKECQCTCEGVEIVDYIEFLQG